MSGLLSSIGKVFSKIISSPVLKIVAIAAAVYFTAGMLAPAAFAAPEALTVAGDAFMPGALASVGVDGMSVAPLLTEAGATSADLSAITGEGSQLAVDGVSQASSGVADSALGGPGSELGATGNAFDSSANLADGLTPSQITGAPDTSSLMNVSAPTPDSAPPTLGGPDEQMVSVDSVTGMPDASQAVAAPGSDPTAGISGGNAFGLPSATTQASVTPTFGTQVGQLAGNTMDWYNNLNPMAQQIVGKGISGVGQGIGSSLQQQAAFAQQDKAAAQLRASQFSHANAPSMTYSPGKYKTPGIINSATGA